MSVFEYDYQPLLHLKKDDNKGDFYNGIKQTS